MDLRDASLGDIAARLAELLDEHRTAAPSADSLLDTAHGWEVVGRAADAARTWVAAEIAHESRRELDIGGLAYRRGFPSAKKLLAATASISERTAASRIALGQRIRSSVSISGTPNPSFFPQVESAFYTGRIGVDVAAMICRTLFEAVTRTGWSEATDQAEHHLVAASIATIADADAGSDTDADADADGSRVPRLYTVEEIGRLAARIREHLDPDGAEPRDAVKQFLRGFSRPRVGADGMARGRYALPPLQLGVFLAAVDSILSPRTPDPTDPADPTGPADPRYPVEPGAGWSSPADRADRGDSVANENARGAASILATPGADSTAATQPVGDPRTIEQKLLDAVMTSSRWPQRPRPLRDSMAPRRQ
jgi:hypothetical protein